MGKLSPEKQKQLDALQAELDQDDDDECVIWVRNSKGHETRLEGDRARKWLRANGYDEDDADAATAAEPLESAKATAGQPKKTAPKKTAAAPAGDGAEAEGDGAELEADAPAGGGRRSRAFF